MLHILSLLTLFKILLFTTAQLWKTNLQLEYAQVDHLVVQLCVLVHKKLGNHTYLSLIHI